ncbi:MAG: peptide deformylase [Prevotellaceae bacterium]|jgi:peptide deformylase|nr:peptide deformylase [Prevotellaceae bacterium]
MILTISAYGSPVLRKETVDIDKEYPQLQELIKNMFDTMTFAEGVGLAAPQVGLPIRLFVIDLSPLADDKPEYKNYKKVFINPEIIEFSGNDVSFEEGCLSIPNVHEKVVRKDKVLINYFDENFTEHEETFSGYPARVIQHEYDHLEGNLFIDKISGIRKQLIKGKLNNITSGRANCKYKIKTK